MSQPPHVIIAGAGYAGLAAYLALRAEVEARRLDLTVVNADDWHLLLPELPLYLTGAEGADGLRLHLRHVVRAPARLIVARIRGLDPQDHAVDCEGDPGRIAADGMLLALGSVAEDFGVPGVREHAITIGAWDDATKLRSLLLEKLGSRTISGVVVVGGGFTGVEIAAAVAERAQQARSGLQVAMVAPKVLPAMPDEVRKVAAGALKRLGVRVVPGHAASVDPSGVRLRDDGSLVQADTVIWAAGVRANPLLAASGLEANPRGQVVVDEHLRAAPRVYCAGDCAALHDPDTDRTIARTAQAALQEGPGAALNLMREFSDRPLLTVRPKERGFLVSLGRREAAGTLAGIAVHGGDVALLKRIVERFHAFQVGGRMALARKLQRHATDARDDEPSTAAD